MRMLLAAALSCAVALSTAASAAPIMNQSGLGQAPDAIVHVKKKMKMKKNMKGMDHSKMKM